MAIYEQTAYDLLNIIENPNLGDSFLFLGEEGYVFTYRRNYQGLMSRIKPQYKRYSREKQGYFDILGNMNNEKLTHKQLYSMLLETTTYDKCQLVWRGEMPQATGKEKHALLCLAMLMFEQEINFGNESFQRRSQFSPAIDNAYYSRPRDLLMGYVRYLFDNNNTECLNEFQNYYGLLNPPPVGDVRENYFEFLENDEFARALMSRPNVVQQYRALADSAPRNPNL